MLGTQNQGFLNQVSTLEFASMIRFPEVRIETGAVTTAHARVIPRVL